MPESVSTEPASLAGRHTGRTLAGRYILSERLGEGATAEVYAAADQSLEVTRAVKLMSGGGAARERLRERLKAEAKGMARLEHPNILPIYDVGADGALDYVVMKLARGGSLQDRLDAEGPLPPELACGFVVQLLSALDAAHQAGIVHRDVKPQNILTNGSGQILLSDFGIALWHQKRATQTGMAMGSLPYMAPEQRLDASRVGPSADLYAVGATLYHLLTSANPVDLFASPDFSPRWDDVPTALRGFIRRSTSYEAVDRYPDASVMAQALLSAMPDVVEVIRETAPGAMPDDSSWRAATTTAVGLLLGEEPTAARVDTWVGSMEPPLTTFIVGPPIVVRPMTAIGSVLLLLLVGLTTFFSWPEVGESFAEAAEAALSVTEEGTLSTEQAVNDKPAEEPAEEPEVDAEEPEVETPGAPSSTPVTSRPAAPSAPARP
ncbi:MAG: serine/threonine protein kinase, partial [Myxococcota bacterium]